MIRWARHVGDGPVEAAAGRALDWTCACQAANGWFANCTFRPGTTPSTHAIAYTLRGLLESYCLTGEERWVDAVRRTAEALEPEIRRESWLRASFHEDWRPAANHACLTGTVQMGGVWLRLYQETGDRRWLYAGLKAVEQAAGRQERVHWSPVLGALAGSFPLWGRYAPLQYPNWATKFLVDGLLVYSTVSMDQPRDVWRRYSGGAGAGCGYTGGCDELTVCGGVGAGSATPATASAASASPSAT